MTFRLFSPCAYNLWKHKAVWKHLCRSELSLGGDSIMSAPSLWTVICFASPVATFHLNDVRQVYGQPSLLRTIRSRVILSPSLCETEQCHARWVPPHSHWLKYLRDVLPLTCNLLHAAVAPESDDESSVGLNRFYGHHALTAKLCLSVPCVPGLTVKRFSMEASPWRTAVCFLEPTKLFSHDSSRNH